MSKELWLAFGIIAAIPLIPTVYAQGVPQTIAKYKVDVTSVSTGFRGTKLIGAAVHNETDQKIGTIDDIIVANNKDKVVYAIISVGGFLGVGDKLVAVPFDGLKLAPDKATLPGATKATLENMPKFTYQK
jgi:hypothetical protein